MYSPKEFTGYPSPYYYTGIPSTIMLHVHDRIARVFKRIKDILDWENEGSRSERVEKIWNSGTTRTKSAGTAERFKIALYIFPSENYTKKMSYWTSVFKRNFRFFEYTTC